MQLALAHHIGIHIGPRKQSNAVTRDHVPNPHRSVVGPSGDVVAIGVVGHRLRLLFKNLSNYRDVRVVT